MQHKPQGDVPESQGAAAQIQSLSPSRVPAGPLRTQLCRWQAPPQVLPEASLCDPAVTQRDCQLHLHVSKSPNRPSCALAGASRPCRCRQGRRDQKSWLDSVKRQTPRMESQGRASEAVRAYIAALSRYTRHVSSVVHSVYRK